MSPVAWLFLVFVAFCVVILVFSFKGILADKKDIRQKLERLAKLKKEPVQFPSASKFAPPKVLHQHNWANFERCVPNLEQVIVLADTVEQPINGLERAVLENFQRGVNYCFIVSGSKVQEEVNGFYSLFERLANIAINKYKAQAKLSDLISILSLPYEWDNVPYVFYRMRDASGTKTIAFRGDIEKAGIAKQYISLSSDSAEALFKMLMGKAPERIESVIKTRDDVFPDADNVIRLTEATRLQDDDPGSVAKMDRI